MKNVLLSISILCGLSSFFILFIAIDLQNVFLGLFSLLGMLFVGFKLGSIKIEE